MAFLGAFLGSLSAVLALSLYDYYRRKKAVRAFTDRLMRALAAEKAQQKQGDTILS